MSFELLRNALRSGNTEEALLLAESLAQAGSWDDVVTATLLVHARPDAQALTAWLARETTAPFPVAAARLEPYLALAVSLHARREVIAAWRVGEEGLRRFPTDARAWSLVAFLRLGVGAIDEATAACATALALAPDALAAKLATALLLGGTDAAPRLLREAAEAT